MLKMSVPMMRKEANAAINYIVKMLCDKLRESISIHSYKKSVSTLKALESKDMVAHFRAADMTMSEMSGDAEDFAQHLETIRRWVYMQRPDYEITLEALHELHGIINDITSEISNGKDRFSELQAAFTQVQAIDDVDPFAEDEPTDELSVPCDEGA